MSTEPDPPPPDAAALVAASGLPLDAEERAAFALALVDLRRLLARVRDPARDPAVEPLGLWRPDPPESPRKPVTR